MSGEPPPTSGPRQPAAPGQVRRRAWFTDTFKDVNGVAKTIRNLTAACTAAGHDLRIVTCLSHPGQPPTGCPGSTIKNFQPLGEFAMPAYRSQTLSIPPAHRIRDYLRRENFSEVILSTPGPVGLAALSAANRLGLPATAIDHTDFPQYARILTESAFLESLTTRYLRWFYSRCGLLLVNSAHYRQLWIERGIAPGKIQLLPRGVDTERFHPARRDADFWIRRGAAGNSKVLLYAGRISKEKNFEVLAAAWAAIRNPQLALAIVGDGPHLPRLRELLTGALFTGCLEGDELATAYASADCFVFPSTTDTFGNVVAEALSSGLPAVVSDQGGPKDLVLEGLTGHITRANNAESFANGISRLLADPAQLTQMSQQARASMQNRSWSAAGRAFWELSPAAT